MASSAKTSPSTSSLGEHLALLRASRNLTLREVEQATEKLVSNAYLSQIENNKINQPSPNMLYALAEVYGSSYEDLMARAGYITQQPTHARAATYAVEALSADEHDALLGFLSHFRHQKKRRKA
jgi:transcriptional regulator with XRE-family HTH domain